MNKLPVIATLLLLACGQWSLAFGQQTFKPRPDAFPPEQEQFASKSVLMATSVDAMASWDRYPTYETYLAMMQRWAQDYPELCTIDTIGISIQGRLILAAHIEGNRLLDLYRPQFFYSSTIHGDEVTGYVMMLRLIDTLLTSYGTSQRLTDLVNSTAIYINPLANPDGTYRRGDNTLQGAVRYNANGVDLNRNYPDPFGTTKEALQQENAAMIDYVSAHIFRLSANLHGGSEVMNYPWDCFTSWQNPHPQRAWWERVCQRFVDTCRAIDGSRFRDVTSSGVVAGGDWYVIHGGRQDYMNYYHNCLEVTMEISSLKTIASEDLPDYWRLLSSALINYIEEIHGLPGSVGISDRWPVAGGQLSVYPNPATDVVHIQGLPEGTPIILSDMQGRRVLETSDAQFSVLDLPAGLYLLSAGSGRTIVIKK